MAKSNEFPLTATHFLINFRL